MADAVTKLTLVDSATHYVIHCTNISDGTGEAAVIKADKSAIAVASDGAEAGSLEIEKAVWNCEGMQVRIYWDHTTDDTALVLSGNGAVDFTSHPMVGVKGLKIEDPRSTGGTGDLLFTTSGHSSGDIYQVTLWLRKNPA